MNFARDHGTDESLRQMAVLQSAIFDPADLLAAVQAWQTRRDPDFDGLPPLFELETPRPG
ncbi:hypothetical protein [Burkholderia gladioli]|nr:hypothetical protein [Burkholderia gladioli]